MRGNSDKVEQPAAELLLQVESAQASLSLVRGEAVIEQVFLGDTHSLAEKLLPAADALLDRHGLRTDEVRVFRVKSSLPEMYSSRRIAETIAQVYSFAVFSKKACLSA